MTRDDCKARSVRVFVTVSSLPITAPGQQQRLRKKSDIYTGCRPVFQFMKSGEAGSTAFLMPAPPVDILLSQLPLRDPSGPSSSQGAIPPASPKSLEMGEYFRCSTLPASTGIFLCRSPLSMLENGVRNTRERRHEVLSLLWPSHRRLNDCDQTAEENNDKIAATIFCTIIHLLEIDVSE